MILCFGPFKCGYEKKRENNWFFPFRFVLLLLLLLLAAIISDYYKLSSHCITNSCISYRILTTQSISNCKTLRGKFNDNNVYFFFWMKWKNSSKTELTKCFIAWHGCFFVGPQVKYLWICMFSSVHTTGVFRIKSALNSVQITLKPIENSTNDWNNKHCCSRHMNVPLCCCFS